METSRTKFNQLENIVAQPHCFTLRLPTDIYVEVYELSQSQGKTMNATVIDLIKIAMTHKMSVRRALEDMLAREFPSDAVTSES